jgi:DNA repair protein RadA/Sms
VDTSALDVFAATAGGLSASEPGVDVALALAIASAALGFAVSPGVVAIGEVGLAGELRAVPTMARRIQEARRLGARAIILPASTEIVESDDLELRRCHNFAEASAAARLDSPSGS